MRQGKNYRRVPAHYASVEQIHHPEEFSHPQSDEYGDYLAEQNPAGGTEGGREVPDQRIHFECAEMKSHQRR
jgi:hypothetical protein